MCRNLAIKSEYFGQFDAGSTKFLLVALHLSLRIHLHSGNPVVLLYTVTVTSWICQVLETAMCMLYNCLEWYK